MGKGSSSVLQHGASGPLHYTIILVSTAECIIGNGVLFACTVNAHKRQRIFLLRDYTYTVPSWLIQQKQCINPYGKRDISASVKGAMIARVLERSLFLYNR